MGGLAAGMLVRHTSLGIGRVVAVESTAVHVFFPASEKRQAAKLRWPAAEPLLSLEGVAPDAWLAGLSSFALEAESGRYALAPGWITHDQAVAEFLAASPRGLVGARSGPETSGPVERATRWRAAAAEWATSFGGGAGEQLLAADDVRGLAERAARVAKLLALVPGTLDRTALVSAFAERGPALAFFEALLAVVSVPSPARARFDKLFAATRALPVEPAAAWPIATVFPFLASTRKQMVLAPKAACAAAEKLGFDLRFEAEPNWATYSAFRAFSEGLLERLHAIGARDLVDVEVFLHATATRRAPPVPRAKAAAPKKKR